MEDDLRRKALRQCTRKLTSRITFCNIKCYLEDDIHLSRSEVEQLECAYTNYGNTRAMENLLSANFSMRIRYWPEFLKLLRKADYRDEAELLESKLQEIKGHGSNTKSRKPKQVVRVTEGGASSLGSLARHVHAMESRPPTSPTNDISKISKHVAAPFPGEKWQAFYLLDKATFDRDIGVTTTVVGEGDYGKVLKAREKFRQLEVVVKTEWNDTGSRRSGKQFTMEKESAHVKHPYILPVVAMCEQPPRRIVSPYMVKGELERFIASQEIDVEMRLRITYQLCQAVCHLHNKTTSKKQIVHRDIAPRNILLDEKLNVRLGDLGWSCYIHDDRSCATVSSVVNQAYSDPEALQYMAKSRPRHDVYSVGLIMLRLLTLNSIDDIHRVLKDCENDWTMIKEALSLWVDKNMWGKVSEKYLDAAIGCLKPPQERKTAVDLCNVLKDLMTMNDFKLFEESCKETCISCLMNPRVGISVCPDSQCIFYCKGCLVNRFANPVFCPSHGEYNRAPIGNDNWFLLAIGGDTYQTVDPKNMFYRDAERVCNIFQHPAVCGMRPSNVKLCCQQKGNLTSDAIVTTLQDMVKKMDANFPLLGRGRLVIFYSGHGDSKQGLFLTGEKHLKAEQLKTVLHQMDHPADVLVVIDCCYAAKQGFAFDLTASGTTGIQISSCGASEKSRSGFAGDCHSVFSDALVSCLSSRLKSCTSQTCHKCEEDKRRIVSNGFIDLNFLKSYLHHHLSIKPTYKGEHLGEDIYLAYECHSEIIDHLVDFVDSRDRNDIVTKRVYITDDDFKKVEKTTVDQLREFKQLVLNKHAMCYVNLPESYSKSENYKLYTSWNKELENFNDLSELLKVKGIPTMKFIGGQTA